MTVSYQYDVASSTSGGFTRLLFKWKGSLYKLVYRELVLFCMAYGAMSMIYRYVFTEPQKRSFEQVVVYCDTFMNYIPLSFILGFYVSFVATRWWQQYMAIPWPDKIMHAIALHVVGYDDKGRIMRRTLMRYLNLSLVLVLRSISSAVKKRFPTLEHLVEAGFMTTTELEIYRTVPNKEFNTYWIPCTWFTGLLKDARGQRRISDPIGVKLIMEEFNEFRQKCGMLWSYDWVSIPLVYTQVGSGPPQPPLPPIHLPYQHFPILLQEFLEFRSKCGLLWCYDWVSLPLVYTQVVTIATYSFFLACIVGRQYVERSTLPYKNKMDLYIPVFTLLQFFFYMGLLKVAEQLINPFGDDDEDFELNWIIDRHIKVSYLIVDTLLLRSPPLVKDLYWDDESPVLPYTEAAVSFKKRTYRGSVAHMVVPEEKQNLILPDIIEEGDEDQDVDGTASSRVSLKTSLNNISTGFPGSRKEMNTLNVPDEGINSESGSPSPRRGTLATIGRGSGDRGGSMSGGLSTTPHSKSAPASRLPSRRGGTAGIKGIGSALVAVGSHQGFLAADPEEMSQAGVGHPNGNKPDTGADEELDYLVLPFQACWSKSDEQTDMSSIDIDNIAYVDEVKNKTKQKSSFRLPASLKAKVAVRNKKPVITWRPYQRPVDPGDEDIGSDNFPEPLAQRGCFEDECAFMWRTIEDDSDSLRTAKSTLSDDQYLEMKTDSTLHPDATPLGHYQEVRSKLGPKNAPAHSIPPDIDGLHRRSYRSLATARLRYRTRGRARCRSCSMPSLKLLPEETSAVVPELLKSLSENSVFIEAVASRLKRIANKTNTKDRRTLRKQQSLLNYPIATNPNRSYRSPAYKKEFSSLGAMGKEGIP